MLNRKGLNRLLTQLKTEDWIGRMIDTHQELQSPERWGYANLDIHPSSSGSPCARDVELGMLGYRTAIKPKNRRRMDNGTFAHTRWEGYFKDMGILYASEVNVKSDDPQFNGTCDLVVQHPTTGKLMVGEIKTMNQARWRKVPDQHENHNIMMRHLMATERPYVYQLSMYVRMIPKVMNWDISNECFFLFENTDTQEFKIRYCEPDEQLIDEAFANSLLAQHAAKEGKLIDPPYKRDSLTCTMCYKKTMCYLLQDGDEDAWENVNNALKSI